MNLLLPQFSVLKQGNKVIRPSDRLLFLLQLATVCVFAGRAWQHLFFDAPSRELLWDAGFMQGIIEGFTSLTWQEYVTHPKGDVWIQRFIFGCGIFLATCSVVAACIRWLHRFFRLFLWIGAAYLFVLALLYLKEYFFHAGQFFEYALQFSSPAFFWFALKKEGVTNRLALWMKLAVALTFICHGLYALGYYPRPGVFMSMTMHVLGLDEQATILFLRVAGILDFVVGIGIFLPEKWVKPVLIYAAAWGLATALARTLGNFFWQFAAESLHQHVFETVYRLPHFFVPLALFFYHKIKPSS